MKFLLICDYRENYRNYATPNEDYFYNDHPTKKNIDEISSSIKSLGYDCKYFGGIPELIHAVDHHIEFFDQGFLNFTDGMDENYSRVQAPALLDILKVPYSGSEVFPTVLMNNKHFCKQALKDCQIHMPQSSIVSMQLPLNIKVIQNWSFPIFVKPNCEGSSLGISSKSVCYDITSVQKRCTDLLQTFDEILIEEFISGIDVTNYLIGNGSAYVLNDVITAKLYDESPYAIYGPNEKHNKLRTLFLNNEYLPNNVVKEIQNKSIQIAKTIGVRDICRIDYRVDPSTWRISFIEINSAPRFSSTSEIGFIAKKNNSSFTEMVQLYIQTFLNRI